MKQQFGLLKLNMGPTAGNRLDQAVKLLQPWRRLIPVSRRYESQSTPSLFSRIIGVHVFLDVELLLAGVQEL